LPFRVTIPENEQFATWQYEDEGCLVRVFPPVGRTELREARSADADEVRLDGVPAVQADTLRIDFQKDAFDRGKTSPCDPPEAVIGRAINYLLIRLRYVTRAAQIRPLDHPWGRWRLDYLRDDETELEVDEGLVRGRGALAASFSWVVLNKQIWDDVHSVPPDFDPPPWEELLIDAQADLPRIGPAVVLAATALEVFISHTLDNLARTSTVPAPLWAWINKRGRGNYLREPTVEEQYDTLLKFFTGHSLKDELQLWSSFQNLKTARNTFVHGGVASLGGTAVPLDTARKLVASAGGIIATVRNWIPAELQWPVFKHSVRIQAFKKLT
jgi:hypothetical protein